jgi:hypothetical protein
MMEIYACVDDLLTEPPKETARLNSSLISFMWSDRTAKSAGQLQKILKICLVEQPISNGPSSCNIQLILSSCILFVISAWVFLSCLRQQRPNLEAYRN